MTHLGERPDYGQGALPFSAIPPALWVRPLGSRLIRPEELALFTGVRGRNYVALQGLARTS
jgi:hypothetical protein